MEMKKKIERDIEEHYRRFFRESSQTRYHIEELKKKKKEKKRNVTTFDLDKSTVKRANPRTIQINCPDG